MKYPTQRPSPTARARWSALGLSGLFLLTSCVYVRVRGNPDWIEDAIHESHSVPASYRSGEMDLGIQGFFWDHSGNLELEFDCDPAELDQYVAGVRSQVERKIRDGGGRITKVEESGERTWIYEFEDDGDPGTAELAILERPENPDYPYLLKIGWDK